MNSREQEAGRLDARSREYVRLAAEDADPAVKRDRLLQASAARIQSGRLLEAEAKSIPGPPEPWGVSTTYGAPNHTPAPVFTPGPR